MGKRAKLPVLAQFSRIHSGIRKGKARYKGVGNSRRNNQEKSKQVSHTKEKKPPATVTLG